MLNHAVYPALTISHRDYIRISELLLNLDPEQAERLNEELSRAVVVADDVVPDDVVTLESKVKFIDLENGKESEVMLVLPMEANVAESRISILAPVGSALIGLRVGQCIDWPIPRGKTKKIRVTSVHREALAPAS